MTTAMSFDPVLDSAPLLPMVEIGGARTSYRQAGEGRPVLLLDWGTHGGDPPRLLSPLARHFRVLAPLLAEREMQERSPLDVVRWLHDLVDTLGLDRPAVVAASELALATLAFAVSDPERAERSVIIFPHDAGASGPAPILRDCLGGARHPLLLAGLPRGGSAIPKGFLEELVGFLEGRLPAGVAPVEGGRRHD
jgi:pimeloyl-ACP methyl ester carboxylesterase